jgi:hypothetical protein
LLGAACAVLLSCDISTLIGPQAAAPEPGAVGTIVVQTAQAAYSQTAAAMPPTETPTLTPVPTRTATVAPSPTPTFIFVLATPTRSPVPSAAAGDYACLLVDQNPPDGSTIKKNQSFTVKWIVQNSGKATWDSGSVDFVYVSGTKLATVRAADLPKSVAPGQNITLSLNMVAPSSTNKYKTVWTLERGKDAFCRLTINIVVK